MVRQSNFSHAATNKAAITITPQIYDRRALDTTAVLPLINSLNQLAYLTSTSPRIRDIITLDGGLDVLVRILRNVPPSPQLTPRGGVHPADLQNVWKWSLAFQCVVNIGVRGSEAVRTRVVEAGAIAIAIRVLQSHLARVDASRPYSTAPAAQSGTRTNRFQPSAAPSGAAATGATDASVPGDAPADAAVTTATAPATSAAATAAAATTPTPTSLALPVSQASAPAQQTALAPAPTPAPASGVFASANEHRAHDRPERSTSTLSVSASGSDADAEHDADNDVEMAEIAQSAAPSSTASSSQHEASQSQDQGQIDVQATPRPPAPRGLASASVTTPTASTTQPGSVASCRTRTMTTDGSAMTVAGNSAEPDGPIRGPPVTAPEAVPYATPRGGEMTFREEEVLLALQLLAYVSKYAHVRSLFYSDECFAGRFPRRLESYQRLQLHSLRYPLVDPAAAKEERPAEWDPSVSLGPAPGTTGLANGLGAVPAPTDDTAPAGRGVTPAQGADESETHLIPTIPGVAGYYGFAAPLPGPTGVVGPTKEEKEGAPPLVEISGPRWSDPPSSARNVFSIAERFTIRSSRQPPIATGRLAREIQFWAGVIMRNACRKDDERGGVRPCAYMGCGKWESFPRQFAKCRRCRKAKYCSKQCQSLGWASGHRFWCSARPEDEARRDAHAATESVPSTVVPPPTATAAAARMRFDDLTLPTHRRPWLPTHEVTNPPPVAPAQEEELHGFRLPVQLARPRAPTAALGLTPFQGHQPRATGTAVAGDLTVTRNVEQPGNPEADPTETTTTLSPTHVRQGEITPTPPAATGAPNRRPPMGRPWRPSEIRVPSTGTEGPQGQPEPERESAIHQLRTTLHESAASVAGSRSRSHSSSAGRVSVTGAESDRSEEAAPADAVGETGQTFVNPRLLAVRQALTSAPSTAEGSEASDEDVPSVRRRPSRGSGSGSAGPTREGFPSRGGGTRAGGVTPALSVPRAQLPSRPDATMAPVRATRAAPDQEMDPSFSLLSGAETDASMDMDGDAEGEGENGNRAQEGRQPAMRTHLLVAPAVRRTDITGRPLPPPLIASLDADPMHMPSRAGTPGAVLRHMPHPEPGGAATAPTPAFEPQPQDNPFVDPDRELENMPWDAIEGYRLDTAPTTRREGQTDTPGPSGQIGQGGGEAGQQSVSQGRRTSRHSVPISHPDTGHHTDTEVVETGPDDGTPRSLPHAHLGDPAPASEGVTTFPPAPPSGSRFARRAQDDATLSIRRAHPRARAASPSFLAPPALAQGRYMPSPLGRGGSPSGSGPQQTSTEYDEEEEL